MKEELVNIALQRLKESTGIKANWTKKGPLDGLLDLQFHNQRHSFIVEIKKEIRQHQLYQIEKFNREHKSLIVVADHIFPNVKKQLRDRGIAYLETNGNVFFQTNQTYCFVDTNKERIKRKETANRAFTKTGLKVLFYFLQDAELINKTQREIANTTGVGLGNIPQIIHGLKKTGYIISLNKQNYVWEKREELLNRWINEYASELRPKLIKGSYTIQTNWQSIKLNNQLTVWGGEPAADLLTNYLRPEKLILYTKENNIQLMKNYRLIPKDNGELEVLEMFWNNTHKKEIAPPLLIYTELIITGGKRNTETAKLIFDEFIQPKL